MYNTTPWFTYIHLGSTVVVCIQFDFILNSLFEENRISKTNTNRHNSTHVWLISRLLFVGWPYNDIHNIHSATNIHLAVSNESWSNWFIISNGMLTRNACFVITFSTCNETLDGAMILFIFTYDGVLSLQVCTLYSECIFDFVTWLCALKRYVPELLVYEQWQRAVIKAYNLKALSTKCSYLYFVNCKTVKL